MDEIIKNFTKRLTLLHLQSEEDFNTNGLFTKLFYQVITVQNKEELFLGFKTHHIDIVILELDDCRDNTFEIIELINNKYENMITIIISKTESIENLHKSIKLGINDYLLLPLIETDLLESMKRIEKIYSKNEEFENNRQNLNLLKQYQDIADKSSIISKTDIKGR
ncbi:MAG: response regulator, partial [Pseudomonadota bacterium]|nr:response regulator [Pseudomonadota bacterium]